MAHSGMSDDELRRFYEIEKELALRLLESPKPERKEMYGVVYDELFSRVPYHPMLVRKREAQHESVGTPKPERRNSLIHRLISDQDTFLEIGAGDCALSFDIARVAARVYGLDVSKAITDQASTPENFTLVISDGTSIPVPDNSVDVAYSNQLMEHLHPDDAKEQLCNIRAALKPGGRYLCVTPSALSGPHDVSKYFDDVASGLHLKEYTYAELTDLFKRAGFQDIYAYVSHQRAGVHVKVRLSFVSMIEQRARRVTRDLSAEERRRFMMRMPYKLVRQIQLVGVA